jgi:hypothetical protein
MVRQKVKGTGHKQPSDASSEPNFYTMPPVEPERSAMHISGQGNSPSTWSSSTPTTTTTAAVTTAIASNCTMMPYLQDSNFSGQSYSTREPSVTVDPGNGTTTHLINGIDPNSPGLSSLQDAAQLLRGISSGTRGGAFLGAPALGGSTTAATTNTGTRSTPGMNGASSGMMRTTNLSTTSQHTPASFFNASQWNHTEV